METKIKRIGLKLTVIITALITAVTALTAYSRNPTIMTFAPDKADKTITLVIDAGHGGEDGGAVSVSGAYESTINLSIAQKLELIAGFYGVHTVMTRTSEDIEYPESAKTTRERKRADQKNRLELINSSKNAVLISIHQNKYTSSSPHGAQVLYSPTECSCEFANIMQELLISQLDSTNKRIAAEIEDNIFLMNNISCPAVLVECGFLSNPAEESKLLSPEYQVKLAMIIASSYFMQEDTFSEFYFGGTNEVENNILLY